MSSILPVPGVSKESNASYLILEARIEPADTVVHNSSALRVATSDDYAAALSLIERCYAFVYGFGVRASWTYVGGYRCRVKDGESPHSR
jgi:hypothetical protein